MDPEYQEYLNQKGNTWKNSSLSEYDMLNEKSNEMYGQDYENIPSELQLNVRDALMESPNRGGSGMIDKAKATPMLSSNWVSGNENSKSLLGAREGNSMPSTVITNRDASGRFHAAETVVANILTDRMRI